MKNAVIYARYSSEKQTEQSIEGQVRICKEYAKQNDFNIIEVYVDRAMTGKNDNRADFQRMIKDSSKKSFSAVIVYKLDRFSRNRYDSAYNKKELKKNGVKVISATENISDNPEGILLESLLEGLAEYYSAELAQKVTRGIRESVMKGQYLGGPVAYGFNIENKHYVINETEAMVVRMIYHEFLSANSIQEVLNLLQKKHIVNKNGAPFKRHQITNILTKDLYIGTLRGAGIILENKIPAIIDKDVFDMVQTKLSNNIKTSPKANYLLSGKLFCGICMSPMTGTCGTGRNQTYFYYKCKSDKITVKKETIEKYVISTLRAFLSNQNNLQHIADSINKVLENDTSEKPLKSLQSQLKQVNKEIDNLTKAIMAGIINDNIKEKNIELTNKRNTLIEEIKELKSSPTSLNGQGVTSFLLSLANSNEIEDEANLINILVNRVIYTKEKTRIILNLSPIKRNNPNIKDIMEVLENGSSEFSNGLPKK